MILPLLLLAAQITPVQPIVKGTALPPPGSEEAGVMVPVNGLLAGIAARDGQAMAKYLRADGNATVATEKPDSTRTITHITAADLLARFTPGPEKYDERLTDPAIEIDGDIAMVWSPYTFAIDGKVHHCGVDHFSLVREAGSWKIANLSWSSRTTGCAAQ
ncbi:hypothetical protein BH10PSE14_BH10PSE14_43740 [soil metagenome]